MPSAETTTTRSKYLTIESHRKMSWRSQTLDWTDRDRIGKLLLVCAFRAVSRRGRACVGFFFISSRGFLSVCHHLSTLDIFNLYHTSQSTTRTHTILTQRIRLLVFQTHTQALTAAASSTATPSYQAQSWLPVLKRSPRVRDAIPPQLPTGHDGLWVEGA